MEAGTAAGSFYGVSPLLLGIRPEFEGLLIDPCVPAEFESFSVKRQFRGNLFIIRIENPEHVEKGVRTITVDGKEINGKLIECAGSGKTYGVKVIMG
jgi:cellobiose phosphorylase